MHILVYFFVYSLFKYFSVRYRKINQTKVRDDRKVFRVLYSHKAMAFKMEQLVGLGVLMIFIGFVLVFFGSLGSKDSKTKVAVGGFIGFIPFGFGNDKKLVWTVTIVSFVMFLIFLFFRLHNGK